MMKMRRHKDLILNTKWDVLIILDACRYDVFKSEYGHIFDVEAVMSEESCTDNWFSKTFTKRLKDVIYVTANPHITSYKHSWFFWKVVEVWRFGWRKIGCAWTVSPEAVVNTSKLLSRIHPNKRQIIHFLQPHGPYPMCSELERYFVNDVGNPELRMWDALKRGEVNVEMARRCYLENLRWVMKSVMKLLNFFKGKRVVITADHGECFGEDGIYGHPCGTRHKTLLIIPWVELQYDRISLKTSTQTSVQK